MLRRDAVVAVELHQANKQGTGISKHKRGGSMACPVLFHRDLILLKSLGRVWKLTFWVSKFLRSIVRIFEISQPSCSSITWLLTTVISWSVVEVTAISSSRSTSSFSGMQKLRFLVDLAGSVLSRDHNLGKTCLWK